MRLAISFSFLVSCVALAGDISLALYDDGLSCPADCDSHVVFHPTINGTSHASVPGYQDENCIVGETCRVCFDHQGVECVDVTYRGSGPGPHTFDFTPAFYASVCASKVVPTLLQAKCRSLARDAQGLEDKVNCIADPEHELCIAKMATSVEAKATDRIAYLECLSIGQTTYNAGLPAQEKRALHCAYEFERNGGPNSKGLRWRKLQPGACRTGSFVGTDGLDCCSGVLLADGPLGIECRGFYPQQPTAQILTEDKPNSDSADR